MYIFQLIDQYNQLQCKAAAAEPPISYKSKAETIAFWEDLSLLRNISDMGIDLELLEQLKRDLELTNELIYSIFSAHWRTLKSKYRVKGIEADRALELMNLWDEGMSFFKDKSKLRRWLYQPNQYLGGIPPINVLNSSAGIETVIQFIGRLKHGIAA